MKKIIAMLLCVVLTLCLFGCGKSFYAFAIPIKKYFIYITENCFAGAVYCDLIGIFYHVDIKT